MSSESFGHKKPGHCSDCAVDLRASLYLNVQRFVLSNGSTIDASFCASCKSKPWTRERLDALKAQMNDAYEKSVKGVFYGKINGVWGIVRTGAPMSEEQAKRVLDDFCPLTLVKPVGEAREESRITNQIVTSPTEAQSLGCSVGV